MRADLDSSESELQTKKNTSLPGLGCWAFGGTDWGVQNEKDSIAAIKTALELGITHFDTAQAYGKGHSEEVLGKALRGNRDKVFIASKSVLRPPEKVVHAIEVSLRRLKTEYIDLFYIHWPRENGDLEGMIEGLECARRRGLIRQIGVSNFSVEQLTRVGNAGTVDALQICYNLLWRWPEQQLIPYCIEKRIPIVTYSSIAQGILTGKFPLYPQFHDGDHRKSTVFFDENLWPIIYEGVQKFNQIAVGAECSLTDLAINWVVSRPGVETVLVGARNRMQVRLNAGAIFKKVDNSVLDQLTQISNSIIKNIPDTGNIFRYYP